MYNDERKMLFSIIIPVYNIRDYIDKCVTSCVEQREFSNYEIIIVDDGSTDESPQICDNLAQKYSNVKVYHKENGGLSDARNYGVERASGEYLLFVDGDDYISDSVLKTCDDLISKARLAGIDLDVIIADGQFFDIGGNISEEHWYSLSKANRNFPHTTGEEMLGYTLPLRCNWAAWGKFFKRDYWIKNGYKFVKNRYSEDMQFIDRVVLNAGHVCMIPAFVYYKYRESSIVHMVKAEHISSIIDNLSDWEDYFDKAQVEGTIKEGICKYLADSYLHTAFANVYNLGDDQDKKEALREVKSKIQWLNKVDKIDGAVVRLMCYIFGVKNTCKLVSKIKKTHTNT